MLNRRACMRAQIQEDTNAHTNITRRKRVCVFERECVCCMVVSELRAKRTHPSAGETATQARIAAAASAAASTAARIALAASATASAAPRIALAASAAPRIALAAPAAAQNDCICGKRSSATEFEMGQGRDIPPRARKIH